VCGWIGDNQCGNREQQLNSESVRHWRLRGGWCCWLTLRRWRWRRCTSRKLRRNFYRTARRYKPRTSHCSGRTVSGCTINWEMYGVLWF
jgi:hypothetical protein